MLAHWRGFLPELFAVAEWQVLCSPESHQSSFPLVASLPGPWKSMSLTPWLCSLCWSLSLDRISLLAKILLIVFQQNYLLLVYKEEESDDLGVSLPGKEMEFTGSLTLTYTSLLLQKAILP